VPPELFTEWLSEALLEHDAKPGTVAAIVADKAAQWGADQELEACLWHLESTRCNQIVITTLRAARRPKPPSLKEQALKARKDVWRSAGDKASWEILDRAIEALPDE
jgi:hypothetical protein